MGGRAGVGGFGCSEGGGGFTLIDASRAMRTCGRDVRGAVVDARAAWPRNVKSIVEDCFGCIGTHETLLIDMV